MAEYTDIRAVKLRIPYKEFHDAAIAMTFEAKNLYNSAIYLIRQVVTAYDVIVTEVETEESERRKTSTFYKLQARLHDSQKEAISAFNAVVSEVNAKRSLKVLDEQKAKLVPELVEEGETSPFKTILNPTILDNVLKRKLDKDGDVVYKRLPAVVSQQVLKSLINNFTNYAKSIVDYTLHPAKYTGRPRMPGFLHKKGNYIVEIPYAMLSNKTGGFPKPNSLIALTKASVEMLNDFYSVNLKQLMAEACASRSWDDYTVQHVRIVAVNKRKVKIEAIVNLKHVYPQGSLLKAIYQQFGEALREAKSVKAKNKIIADTTIKNDNLRMCGIDMGMNNLMTCAFSTGHKALVFSGERYSNKMELFQRKIDAFISENTTDRHKELQEKFFMKDEDGKLIPLPPNESIELSQLKADIFDKHELQQLYTDMRNWKNDHLHKLSADVVDQAVLRNIQCIVIGRNKGWKDEVNMGRESNREFCSIAHATLIQMIRYKAEKYGIVVLDTEESYTSKSSFVDNDVILKHGEDGNDEKKALLKYSGYRSSGDRNWFIRRADALASNVIKRIHADVNGAFNIIRKVFKKFKYHSGLSMKFTVKWISPRVGATTVYCLS